MDFNNNITDLQIIYSQQQRYYKQNKEYYMDYCFWNAVIDLLKLLIQNIDRYINPNTIQWIPSTYFAGTKKPSYFLNTCIEYNPYVASDENVIYRILSYFVSSPVFYVAAEGYACSMVDPQVDRPFVPYAKDANDMLKDLEDLASIPHMIYTDEFQMTLQDVHKKWLKYLHRHRNPLFFLTTKDRFLVVINCTYGIMRHGCSEQGNKDYENFKERIRSSLYLFDGTLCLKPEPKNDGIKPINEETYHQFKTTMGLTDVPDRLIKMMLQEFQSVLREEEKKQKKEVKASASEYRRPSTRRVIFRLGFHYLFFSYSKETKRFDCYDEAILDPRNQLPRPPIRALLTVGEHGPKYNADPPKDFFYNLTGGDKKVLENIAKGLSYCVSAEKDYRGLIVLTRQSYCYFTNLMVTTLKRQPYYLFDIKQIVSKQSIDWLFNHKLAGSLPILFQNNTNQITSKQLTRLSELIRGKTVSISDPILITRHHISDAQWIFYMDHPDESKRKDCNFPYMVIDTARCTVSSDKPTSYWEMIILPLWGIMLSVDGRRVKRENKASDGLDSVRAFVKDACKVLDQDGEFIACSVLFDSYKAYCTSHGYANLNQKNFNDAIETLFNMRLTRKHLSKSQNPSGFKRIRLLSPAPVEESRETVGQEVQKTTGQEPRKVMSREEFSRYIDQITDDVRSRFTDFPFSQYIKP